jgi:PAS domain S-box-containing protein
MTAWQYTPYTLPLFVTAAITLLVTASIWRRRQTAGAAPLALLTLAVTLWAFFYAIELAALSSAVKMWCVRIEYLGIVTTPLAWLVFAAQFTGRQRWLTARNLVLLSLAPLLTIAAVWTNEIHHLHYAQVGVSSRAGFLMLEFSKGPWYLVNVGVSYLYLLVGTMFLILAFIRTPQVYRGQIAALLTAAFLPWAANGIYMAGLSPFPGLDLTPFAFALASLAIAWGLLRYRLLDIAPVARDVAIENLRDALITTDARQRIVDLNPAAEKLLGVGVNAAVGRPLADLLPPLAAQMASQPAGEEASGEFSLGEGSARRRYHLEIAALHDRRGAATGQLLTLSDITGLRREEESAARRGRQLEAVAQVARAASAIHDLGHLLEQAARLTAEHFGFYHVGIFLLDETSKTAVLQAANSEGGKRMLARGHQLKVGEVGIVGRVAETGRTRIALNVGEDAVFFQNPDLPETRSEMALPLTARDKVIGVLDIQSTQPQAFTQEDIEILQILADQVAIAMDNARLLSESRAVIQQLQSLSTAQARQAWQERLSGRAYGFDYTPLGVTARRTPQPRARTHKAGDDPHSLAVPLNLRGQEIGRILLRRKPSQPPWSEREKALAAAIAEQAALAMENARLVQEAQRRASREQQINVIAAQAQRSTDLETILQNTIRELGNSLGVPRAFIQIGGTPPES